MRGMAVRVGAFTQAAVHRYLAVMPLPGVARAPLSYCQAALRALGRVPWPVSQICLVLWGKQQLSLSGRAAARAHSACTGRSGGPRSRTQVIGSITTCRSWRTDTCSTRYQSRLPCNNEPPSEPESELK